MYATRGKHITRKFNVRRVALAVALILAVVVGYSLALAQHRAEAHAKSQAVAACETLADGSFLAGPDVCEHEGTVYVSEAAASSMHIEPGMYPPCADDGDDRPCAWLAAQRGNALGASYIYDGRVIEYLAR